MASCHLCAPLPRRRVAAHLHLAADPQRQERQRRARLALCHTELRHWCVRGGGEKGWCIHSLLPHLCRMQSVVSTVLLAETCAPLPIAPSAGAFGLLPFMALWQPPREPPKVPADAADLQGWQNLMQARDQLVWCGLRRRCACRHCVCRPTCAGQTAYTLMSTVQHWEVCCCK